MICLAFSISSWVVHAQTDSLKETVVTASRFEEYRSDAAMALQVITREDILNSGVTSLPDALRTLAGINVRSSNAGQFDLNSSVDIGGFGVTATQNTMVLIDGRKLNPIDSSEITWGAIDLSAVERIEIINAGAGVQFGSGASGGLINIITRESKQNGGKVQMIAGSFGTSKATFQADHLWEDKSFKLNAATVKSDGSRLNSQSQSKNILMRGRRVVDAHSYVFAELGAAQQSSGLAGGVVAKVGEGDQRAVKFNNANSSIASDSSTLRVGGFKALSERNSLEIDLSVNNKNSDFNQPYYDTTDSFGTFLGAGFLTGTGRSDLEAQTLSFAPKFKTLLANGGNWVLGLDYYKADQSGVSYFGADAQQLILANQGLGFTGNIVTDRQNVTLNDSAIYSMARLPVNEYASINLGWRTELQKFNTLDVNKVSGQQISSGQHTANAYEVGYSLKVGSATRYYTRLNRSYRFANTDEYWGSDPITSNRVFSGELRPQFTRAFEVGYEYSDAHHQGALTVSKSITQAEIRYNPSYFRNSNLTDDVARLSLMGSYAYTTLYGSKLSMTGRFQKAEFLNGLYAGQTIGLVPLTILTASALHPLDAYTKIGLSVMRVSNQNYDVAPEAADGKDKMPSFTRIDFFWSHQIVKTELKITVNNLLNSIYSNYGGYSYVQAPGATGASNYYYFPSDPRSIHLGLTYRF